MPKIIENLKEKLTEEARRQLFSLGYSNVTIRSVASACKVGIGTVYHYFDSKDSMIASILLVDWIEFIFKVTSLTDESFESTVKTIYDGLIEFENKYSMLFHDEAADVAFTKGSGKYHTILRSQLAEPIRKFVRSDFEADFISESLLSWSMSGTDFDKLYAVISKIIN